ncbi:MAG: fibronectin type III domain-containing protein [Candidatus Nitrosotalea sp.]|nr:fibronectin type III domain-containing protein [Candidatus Nitrosotalea sp.]
MKILGLSLVWLLLFGALVTQGGILSASAIEQTPSLPRNLNASSVSNTQIFLIWDAPVNATGVTGYQIESKTDSGSYSVLNIIGNLTTYLHTGLVANTTYTYRVSAINSAGIGNSSNEATATTLSTPSAPRNLSATVISASQIDLIWNAPSSSGGTPITGYKILRDNSCTGTFVTISNTTNSSTKYSDTGLVANTCYRYDIEAINAIGLGAMANNVTATTLSIPVQSHVPNSPTGLNVKTISDTSLNLTWTAPSDNGGAAITGYLIQRNGTTIAVNTSSNKTSYTDTFLLPSHVQTYRVAAWNGIGLGTFSSEISGITNSTIILPSGNGTNQTSSNLGKLISDLEHQRNQLLKQQRQETLVLIHDCHVQIKNASPENKTQVAQDCKVKIKESRTKYVDLRNQLNTELATLKAQLKLQSHQDKNEKHPDNDTEHSENKVTHSENETEHSENKISQLGNMTEHFKLKLPNLQNNITQNLKIHSEKQDGKNNKGKHNQQGNNKNDD